MDGADTARGERIRQLRRERGYTSGKALAEALGVHPRTIDNWEGGKRIDGPNLARLSELLDVTPQFIWTGEDDDGAAADPVAVLRRRVDALEGRLAQEDGDRAVALRAHDKRVEDELAAIKEQLEALAAAQRQAALVLPDLVSASLELREEVARLRQREAGGRSSSADS